MLNDWVRKTVGTLLLIALVAVLFIEPVQQWTELPDEVVSVSTGEAELEIEETIPAASLYKGKMKKQLRSLLGPYQ